MAAIILAAASSAFANDCSDLTPKDDPQADRDVTALDLVRLRDIGPSSNDGIADLIFSVSPDGMKIAFPLRRADPLSNDYCFGMYVMDVRTGGAPREINRGGKYIFYLFGIAGFVESSPPGTPLTITPKWSPDGQWIAFLRQDGPFPQVWLAKADGSASAQVTNANFAVKDFAWSLDGRSVIFSGKPALEAERAKLTAEGAEGFLYDDRFMPIAGSWPRIREPIALDYFAVDVKSGEVRTATELEKTLLLPVSMVSAGRSNLTKGPNGETAWTTTGPGASPNRPTMLHAKTSDGEHLQTFDAANIIDRLWWSQDGAHVFIQSHNKMRGSSAVLDWGLTHAPSTVVSNDDLLMGCQLVGLELICARERSTEPRRLVSIDLKTGVENTLFDPNPEFQSKRFGKVTRLYWKNDLGLASFGDLVLPPDRAPGQKYPLVVAQYSSRGFLRGGTGDEFPVYALAAKGFAVLNFTRPMSYGSSKGATDAKDVIRLDIADWADRRSVLSSLDAAIDAAVKTGEIDDQMIGLTGLSDGSSTVQYALIHSRRFRAAAVATCCDEPAVIDWLDGPAGNRLFHEYGFPPVGPDEDRLWHDQSLRQNAAGVTTPLLMQIPEHEYLGAIEDFTALKAAGKPVEMYVFPDEYHVKWQPQHRLASYRRTIDWFAYWLKGQQDSDPSKMAQYQQWDVLKVQMNANGSPGG